MARDPIATELLDFIAADRPDEDAFNALALRLFAHQFAHNQPFAKFARARGKTPRTVRHWADIPAVPINAFKTLDLTCCPPRDAAAVFMTSGTTQGGLRGKSYHADLAVYDASMRRNFGERFMRGAERMAMGILFPTPAMMPNSSLAHYLDLAVRHFGAPGSGHRIGPDGIDLPGLTADLERAEATGAPYALLGASFSLVHALDALQAHGRTFRLPAGSRILDTGGFKGQSRELELDAFYDALGQTFGVPRADCVNMYGMTELSTQFYDDGNAVCPSVKSGPHWIRSRVVDPLTGAAVPKGQTGVLAHTDLAHYNIVTTILTEDAGVEVDGGFLLLGRVAGAEAQGCSMAVDEFLSAAG
ncbi:MAG: long-chain fatty acid--CoA ligase [Alphaproteobacteria bacterium]|nr:long-chain fatty acid--CoA ligase [Alphaproteobacteria bacterium]MCB9928780.1 long-chain fatty acid--CoA ligase [Alphaproteobacteria bacterium]